MRFLQMNLLAALLSLYSTSIHCLPSRGECPYGCQGSLNGTTLICSASIQQFDHGVIPEGNYHGFCDSTITALYLQNTPSTSLPTGVFDKLLGLTCLDLTTNEFSSLPVGVFDKLTHLTQLNLSQNKLTALPSGVFDKLTSLTQLDLSQNQLTSIPAGIFDKLAGLSQGISLRYNELTSLPAGVFDNLSNVQQLTLSHNKLTSLPAGIFNHLKSITWLYLYGNNLTVFSRGVFDVLPPFTQLSLDDPPSLCPTSPARSLLSSSRSFNYCEAVCPDGSYDTESTCPACLPGSYCSAGISYKCPEGTYSSKSGASNALDCKPRSSVDNVQMMRLR